MYCTFTILKHEVVSFIREWNLTTLYLNWSVIAFGYYIKVFDMKCDMIGAFTTLPAHPLKCHPASK